jgi:glycosyltransferase involved in cell wall biosynthesis
MKILIALTYYKPHISGLTHYADRLSRVLVTRGHHVTILTSQYDHSLPTRENHQGVHVVRVPVMMRVSKGVIMPTIGWYATRFALTHDVINLHLPQFDAAGIALRGRLFRHPVVLTYHSDLQLPPSLFHSLAGLAIKLGNHVAVRLADRVITNTEDFARQSPFLSRFLSKVQAISPPIEIPAPTPQSIAAFARKFDVGERRPIIGIVARLAAEKGIEYLLDALSTITERYPDAVVLHVGPREPVGEAMYARQLAPLLKRYRNHCRSIGTVTPEELAAFYATCDVQVLPSVNNTESFGMVQVEAALCGTPTVASALPGVRIAAEMTGMGLTVPPRDSHALAEAICEVVTHREAYVKPRQEIAMKFASDTIAARYEHVFRALLEKTRDVHNE